MKVGTELGPRIVESVSGAAMQDVAIVLDDPNPIHLSGEAAAAAGLGHRPVNQGPLNIGYILDMLREHGVVCDIRVRLLANVFAGDRAIAGGRVESVQADRHGRFLARCLVWLDVEGSARAVEGTALLELPGP